MCDNSDSVNIACEIMNLTIEELQQAAQQQPLQHQQQCDEQPMPICGNNGFVPPDLLQENSWLREQLDQIAKDRDRLLCEVASLRLELDMQELKRLPEDR
jgi:hypothetical protein